MKVSDLMKNVGRVGLIARESLQFLVSIEEVFIDELEGRVKYLVKPVSGRGELHIWPEEISFPTEGL